MSLLVEEQYLAGIQAHQVPMSSPTPHWQIWYTVSRDVLLSALAIVWNLVGDPETVPV